MQIGWDLKCENDGPLLAYISIQWWSETIFTGVARLGPLVSLGWPKRLNFGFFCLHGNLLRT